MKFDKEHDLLIVPDVHGRKFWREPFLNGQYAHAIFLGDYTDPYPYEGIERDEAAEVFMEIVELAEQHADKVTLLLGNHDMHYVSKTFERLAMGSRYSLSLRMPVLRLYEAHKHLFSLAFEADYEDVHCLLTHAGVSSTWLREHEALVGEPTADHINALMDSEEGVSALADVGWSRGGWALSGGPMWADYTELVSSEPLPGLFQIFGHTQNLGKPLLKQHMACIDCHRTFMLSELVDMRRRLTE